MSTDVITGHVPSDIIYGPVNSRRFGRSLGVSFSAPQQVACPWRCPYCQLNQLPAADIDHPLRAHLIRQALDGANKADADVVCLAGSGEPSIHPDFTDLLQLVARFSGHLPLILLTNGDGLRGEDDVALVNRLTRCYLKVDPGPRLGAWRRVEQDHREHLFAALQPLRWQSMLFDHAQHGGNVGPQHKHAFVDLARRYQPEEIQLATVARPSSDEACRPVSAAVLAEWQHELLAAGIATSMFSPGD